MLFKHTVKSVSALQDIKPVGWNVAAAIRDIPVNDRDEDVMEIICGG